MTSDALTIERRDQVMILHLDDGKANALSFDLIAALMAALAEAEADDGVGAVVIHGREGKFSGGFDLGVMLADDFSAIVNLVANGGELVRTIYGCSVPVVAASTGHALAAGALMLLGCDVRIGADGPGKVGLNEVAIKMVLPDWALTIAVDRLSKRHVHRATANARLTDSHGAVDANVGPSVVRPTRAEAEAAVRTLLAWAGENPGREGLLDTPKRVVKAYEEFFSGYRQEPSEILERTFREGSQTFEWEHLCADGEPLLVEVQLTVIRR